MLFQEVDAAACVCECLHRFNRRRRIRIRSWIASAAQSFMQRPYGMPNDHHQYIIYGDGRLITINKIVILKRSRQSAFFIILTFLSYLQWSVLSFVLRYNILAGSSIWRLRGDYPSPLDTRCFFFEWARFLLLYSDHNKDSPTGTDLGCLLRQCIFSFLHVHHKHRHNPVLFLWQSIRSLRNSPWDPVCKDRLRSFRKRCRPLWLQYFRKVPRTLPKVNPEWALFITAFHMIMWLYSTEFM